MSDAERIAIEHDLGRVLSWGGRAALWMLSCALLLELMFRTFLPAAEMPVTVQTPDGFLLYDTCCARTGHASYGNIPTTTYGWRINDRGWNSAIEYVPADSGERERPLVALIGDSSIEGLRTGLDGHISTHLRAMLGGDIDVYAFGRGAQPLSQMVLLMDRIDSIYSPDAYVAILGQEAVFTSLIPDWAVSFHYIVPGDTTFYCVDPATRRRSPTADLLMRSALVRYFIFHTNVRPFSLFELVDVPRNWNADLTRGQMDEAVPAAARFLLDEISRRLQGRRMLVFLDHWIWRYAIYEGPDCPFIAGESVPEDFPLLISLDEAYRDIGIVSLRRHFRDVHEATGRRFESSDGRHLSGEGNRVVAEAIVLELEERGILDLLLAGGESAGGTGTAASGEREELSRQ